MSDTFPTLISIADCAKLTSMSRAYINKKRIRGEFPQSVPLGDKRIAFVRDEVELWVRERIASRGREAA